MVNSIRNGGQVTYFTESYAVIRYSVASVPPEYFRPKKKKKRKSSATTFGTPDANFTERREKKSKIKLFFFFSLTEFRPIAL
jgi:hypothetical protein